MMKADQQRMRDVLVDTIRLLCRTGIQYSKRLRVQGLLGITVDDDHVFLISVDDCIASNCREMDAMSDDYADDSNASDSHVDADVAASETRSENCNVDGDGATSESRCDEAAAVNRLSLNQSNHENILASVAMSVISSVTPTLSAGHEYESSSQNALPVAEGVCTAALPASCQASSHNGGASEPLSTEAVNISSWSSAPTEGAVAPSDDEPQAKMETDIVCNSKVSVSPVLSQSADNVMSGTVEAGESVQSLMAADNQMAMPPLISITNQHIRQLAAAANQSPHQFANFDDFDSSIGDSNDDGDSDHTSGSESEDIVDYVSVPHMNTISSLQIDPRTLVAGVTNWPASVTCRAQSLSDGGTTDGVQLNSGAAVLTGVHMPTATPQAPSAYYQQQMLAAAAAAAHNRAARAAAVSIKSVAPTTESTGLGSMLLPSTPKDNPPSLCASQRRLPRRPRESQDKRFRCPFCELAYYHKKHLKYHLTKKHGF